nr:integrase, catalytic region, zinc finger, CCHC-type, peptidase aspartic, catalytic [Tanacetum cinerariifolium]
MLCLELKGDDLLTRSHDLNLSTISISKMAASSLVCLMSKATSIKSWLWHRRLSLLNFGTINQLTKDDLVRGHLKFKYDKDHLCSACEQGKSKRATFKSKPVPRRNEEVSTNSAAPDLSNNEDTHSSSTIIIDDNEAPLIVSTSEEQTSTVTNDIIDESI